MPIYGTSFLDGEDQTYAGLMKVEKCVIEEYFDAELVVSQETKNLLILECSL